MASAKLRSTSFELSTAQIATCWAITQILQLTHFARFSIGNKQSCCNVVDVNYISIVMLYEPVLYSHYVSRSFFLFAYRTTIRIQYLYCSNSFSWRVSLHFRHQTCWIAYKSNSDCLAKNEADQILKKTWMISILAKCCWGRWGKPEDMGFKDF